MGIIKTCTTSCPYNDIEERTMSVQLPLVSPIYDAKNTKKNPNPKYNK